MNKKVIFFIVVALLIAGVVFYFWNKKRNDTNKIKDTSPKPKTAGETTSSTQEVVETPTNASDVIGIRVKDIYANYGTSEAALKQRLSAAYNVFMNVDMGKGNGYPNEDKVSIAIKFQLAVSQYNVPENPNITQLMRDIVQSANMGKG
jgi:predicted negative regulator of RcsB-dependent stress response